MKKITLLILMLFFSIGVRSQFSEGFESANLPDLVNDTWDLGTTGLGSNGIWGVFDNGVGLSQSWKPAVGPAIVHSGNQAAFKDRENNGGAGLTSQDFLATPLITIPNNGQLRFWARSGFLGNQGAIYKIMIAPGTADQNDPSAYTLVEDYTETEWSAAFNVYEEKVVNLTAYSNQQHYIAFVIEFTQPTAALAGERIFVDDVSIVEQCLDPTDLAAGLITQTSASLSWANPGGATQWEIEIIPAADTPTGVGTVINSNPFVATETLPAGVAFTPTTNYVYFVRAICSSGVPSQWVGPFAFTTSSPGLTCDSPIVISTLPYSTNDNTANYEDNIDSPQGPNCAGTGNFMTGDEVFYAYTPTESGAISITMTPSGSNSAIFVYEGCSNVGIDCVASVANTGSSVREIPSLAVTAGTTYIIVISTGNFTQTVGYELVIQELNCAAPTGLSATSTGVDLTDPENPVYSVELSWDATGGATSWEIEVQPVGSPIPAGAGVTVTDNTDFEITTFGDGTPLELDCYQYWVRASCGDGTFSPWEGPYEFCTTTCDSGCNYQFIMTDTFGDGWNGGSMNVVQNGNIVDTIGPGFTDGDTMTQSVSLCDGAFELVWTQGGTFPGEIGVSIVNPFGQTIFVKPPGTGSAPSTIFSGTVDCANPSCLPPTNLTVVDVNTSGATLSWIPNGPAPLSYNVYAVPVGSPAPDETSTPTFSNVQSPFVATGLTPDTAYVYYVQSNCELPGPNPWSTASVSFTTLPTCPKPTGLEVSGITMNEATFSWTAGGAETAWQVLVLPAGSPAPDATTAGWQPAATNSFTWTGLTAGTSYDFYVRGVCAEDDISTWAGPLTFNTTICPPADQCLYTFTMTDTFGDGWNGNTMNILQNGIVVATIGGTFTTGAGPVNVQVALCHGVPFELFWNEGGFFSGEVGVSITSFLNEALFTMVPGSNEPGNTLYQGIGECIAPTCLKPTDVTVSNITLDSALVSWTENNVPPATSWDILVLPASAPAPLPTATGWTNVSTNPFTIDELEEATNYKVYVRSVCSDTDKSFWSFGTTFNTPICLPSNLCEYSFVMVDSFGDGWNGNTMNVTQNGILVTTLTGPTNADDQNPVSVTIALCNNVPFELFWNTGGSFANEVGVTILNQDGTQVFTKAPGTGSQGTQLFSGMVECVPFTCPKPVQLAANFITETSAVLSWTEASTATTWEILLLPAGSPPPTPSTPGNILTTDNPYTATGLTSGTAYVFYVRALCSDTDVSNWSGPINFNTLISNDECADAIPVPVNPDQLCQQTVSGTVIGATASSDPNGCFGTSDDDVWFSFVATSTQHSIQFGNFGGSTSDLFHVLYSGECGNLTQLYCSDPEESVATGLVPGQTYLIRVYTWTSSPNQTSTFTLCVGTIPPPITTSTTAYTVPQLVEEILLNDTCATVSNITWSTGTDFSSTNGIGYFTKNGSTFPFDDGIVLTTGNADNAPGPNQVTLSDGGFPATWPGDPDLQAIVNATGNTDPVHNATILEFDFIPLTDTMSFRFLFASEEYGTFQCSFSDVFAFLLTDVVAGTTTNIAVVPSTTTPISVVTIRDNAHNGGCPSVNPQYFGQFYELPSGLSPLGSPTEFNGITVPLTASSPVVPGTLYHIKLAIADYRDTAFDSAVFLEGGSFGIGDLDLGQNLLEANNTAVCFGETVTLETSLDPEIYSFQWSKDGVEIEGATGPDYTVSEEGEYNVHVVYTGTTCEGDDDIIVEFYNPIEPAQAPTLFFCDQSGNGVFDLTQNTDEILATLGSNYTLTYYTTLEDAQLDVNQIPNPTTYVNVSNPQTIYVKVLNDITGCWNTTSFDLQVDDLTPVFTIPKDVTICEGDSFTIAVSPENFELNDATYAWTLDGADLPDTTSSITVTAGGVYEVTVNRSGCVATQQMTVNIGLPPLVDELADVTVCDSYVLPALSANNGYFTAPDGGGDPLAAGTQITQSQTIYIFAQLGPCQAQSEFVVTVNQTPSVAEFDDVVSCGSYTLPALTSGSYYTGPGGTGTELAAGTVLSESQTVYVYAQTGTTPNCTAEDSFAVTINQGIDLDPVADVTACDSYELPALTQGNYYTGTGGTGAQLAAGTVLTESQTVYVYVQQGTCSDEESFTVTLGQTPDFTLSGGCVSSKYIVEFTIDNASFDPATATYEWSASNGGQIDPEGGFTNATAIAMTDGTYTLTVTSGGCSSSESFEAMGTMCTIQKGISANNDGDNDYFDLEGQDVRNLEIFNRYGMSVYRMANYTNQWYGQSDKGEELPDGTYYYVIERRNGESLTGWIYISRAQN